MPGNVLTTKQSGRPRLVSWIYVQACLV